MRTLKVSGIRYFDSFFVRMFLALPFNTKSDNSRLYSLVGFPLSFKYVLVSHDYPSNSLL